MFKSLIQTDSEGIVRKTVLDVEQYNYSTGSFLFPNDPVVIDNDLSVLTTTRARLEDTTPVADTVFIHPYTEQILSGTVYGGFELNEQIVQSPVAAEVVNFLALDGATATAFEPTVSSIGVTGAFLGKRAANFKGTYNDLVSGKGAGLKLPSFNSSQYKYFMVEGFLYFQNLPVNYDSIVMTRSLNSVSGTTNDSFSVECEHTTNQLLLKFNLGGTGSSGFSETVNICGTNGITTGKWHHFAFSIDSGTTTEKVTVRTWFDGVSEYVSVFDNDYSTYGYTFENIKNSVAPLHIGCGPSGDRPFKGWMDSIIVSGGDTLDVLRGYNVNLLGITIPPEEPVVGEYTVYGLNMNGPLGTKLFPCATATRVVSSATYISNTENKVGVGMISRKQSLVNGLTLFSGVCYGHEITGMTAGPCFGANSGSCMIVTGVSQLHDLTTAKRIRSNAAEFTIAYLLGSTTMNGFSGASGDFPTYFSKEWGGNTFSYLATQTNTTELKFLYDTVVVSGRTGIFYVKDYASGSVYGVETADVKNLYADVVEYHAVSSKIGVSAASAILGITGMEGLYAAKGLEDEAIAQKVAPNIDKVGILYINNNARLTKKTTNPERAFSPYTIEAIVK